MLFFIINQTLLWMATEQGNGPGGASMKIIYYNDTLFSFGTLNMSNFSTDYDVCSISYSMNGTKLWQNCYGGNANSNDHFGDAIIGIDGYIYTTAGVKNLSSDYDIVVYKHNRANLIPVWSYLYNSSQNRWDESSVIVQDNSGNLYVGGYSDTIVNNTTSQKHIVLSLNQNGNLRWIYKNYVGNNWGYSQGVRSIAYVNNAVYASGTFNSSTIFSLNANNGSLKWYNSQVLPNDNIIYDNGYLYVSGVKWFAGVPKLTVDKVDTINGSSIWGTIVSDSIATGSTRITKGTDGYIYFIGCASYNNVYQYIISKIDPQNGQKIFASNYSILNSSCPGSTPVIYGNNGSLYFGGKRADSLVIYKINSQNGNLIWKWTYPQSMVYSIVYVNSNPPKICGSGYLGNNFLTFCIQDNSTQILEKSNLIIKDNKIIVKLSGVSKNNLKIALYSVDGRKIYESSFEIKNGEVSLNKPDRRGIYIIKIESIGSMRVIF
ncbi:MAG: hypothetical protein ABIL76_00145 [candidate division WOR-3 bacterium]